MIKQVCYLCEDAVIADVPVVAPVRLVATWAHPVFLIASAYIVRWCVVPDGEDAVEEH